MEQRFQMFEPEKFIGSNALVATEGTIKPVKLTAMTATASLCAVDEIEAKKIKCGVTFQDLKTWGLDEALCVEETCVGSGFKI